MASAAVWIGIDGGGTKTKAYLIDAEGNLLGMPLTMIFQEYLN